MSKNEIQNNITLTKLNKCYEKILCPLMFTRKNYLICFQMI